MQKSITTIALAGSGNVAWHLAKALSLQGFRIQKIWSRDYAHAQALAGRCNSAACTEIADLREAADLIIIAVPDNAIADVAGKIGKYHGIVVHTAGSVPLDVLTSTHEHSGVFYPLQTFSKETSVIIGDVPFFLESSSAGVMQALKQLAVKLSPKVYEADSHQRLMLHIAAVFASNYSNLMYVIGNELLSKSNLPPEIIHPLILATAHKATSGDPMKMQTGPARRHDNTTIAKHMDALALQPEYAQLYGQLARLISKKY
jgi:predicted short-subunit dehydrogenase-like oxidoreductase (DUF2520 family)